MLRKMFELKSGFKPEYVDHGFRAFSTRAFYALAVPYPLSEQERVNAFYLKKVSMEAEGTLELPDMETNYDHLFI